MAKADYRKVASKEQLKEGSLIRVELEGRPIVLAMTGGKIYAMDAVCSHEGGPLEEGALNGYELKCPWHYAVFDVRNAKVSDQTVWATDLQSYPVKVDETSGDILLSLQPKPAAEATTQEARTDEKRDSDVSERKFYEEEERKSGSKLSLDLLSRHELHGTDIMTFKLARKDLEFEPGQFAYFKLDGVTGDSKGSVRHFSIASSPTEQEYLMISTRIRDSPYKQKLASLTEGRSIMAWGPQGAFVLHDDYSRPAVFLSGGIGVTPFRSMIKYATDKQLPVKITMFDSNKNRQGILYKEEFDGWTRQNKNLKIVYAVTDESEDDNTWTGERTRIDKSMIERHLNQDQISRAIFYICGPPGMLKAMQDILQKDLGIPKDRLKIEAFTGY